MDETKLPAISQLTSADGLKFNSVLLAENLVPSKLEDSTDPFGLLSCANQAKELLKESIDRKRLYKLASEIASQRRRIFTCCCSGAKRKSDTSKEIIAALGSTETIYSLTDCGLFAAVLTAYNNHWKLRTSPDDWWFCVINRVTGAINKNANKKAVRKMFVDHVGMKTIEVEVSDTSIYTVDYSCFFDQIAKGVKENIKVPEFVDGMTADFSTTTAVQKIVSQITLMSSVQKYFLYKLRLYCGIPAVEMLGTEDDWNKLKSKLKVLRTLLEPIENDLGLESEWWDLVEKVFSKLLATYQGRPDREWWSHIFSYDEAFGSGGDGKRYNGWMTEFLEGTKDTFEYNDMTTGLVSVPLTLKQIPSGVEGNAILIAGMLGFTLHTDDTSDSVSVQPFQGWSLLLSNDSPFCK